MKIALAQINCTVGDLAGNAAKILDYAERAKAAGARVLLTPELSLTGYSPEDLLLRDGFCQDCDKVIAGLARRLSGIAVVVGHPQQIEDKRYNAASVIDGGRVVATYHKHRLPNSGVFDELRYFTPGTEPCVVEVDGVRLAFNICHDVWDTGPATAACRAKADILLVQNASPYHTGKQEDRYHVVRSRIVETGLPVVYLNLVGGQDELVFDGCSFVMDRKGNITQQLPQFEETLAFVEFDKNVPVPAEVVLLPSEEESVYRALCLGVKDYVGKNGFPGVVLGLSGGIDSALTLAVAVDALGAERVQAVMMPSPYTADISLEDARAMAEILGVRYSEIPIKPVFDSFLNSLSDEFKDLPADTTEENIQARIRGTLLMALSNKHGSVVLITGNKSEMAVGYATLYGDMAGGFAVLKDVPKTLVYRLSHYRNSLSPVIPERIITRPPSAELKPNQTDQDVLPPYEVLDAILAAYVEANMSPAEIIEAGYAEADVRKVVGFIDRSEYKRRQSPVGVRVTSRAFGKDWRYPITSKYKPGFF